MVEKFRDFDVYQLGKYNKERNLKRKARKKREQQLQFPDLVPRMCRLRKNSQTLRQAFEPDAKPALTMKRMIRQLHISKPVEPIMSLIGKKYPATHAEFVRSGLRGQFDPTRAGKRMKLPGWSSSLVRRSLPCALVDAATTVPETWETLVSAKGNKAATWEELIEHKKLPFMAMMRNIRNMILCGIKPRYHKWVQNKLMDEQTIANSRQFPFSFFSAYEVRSRDDADAVLIETNRRSFRPTWSTTRRCSTRPTTLRIRIAYES